MEKVENISQNSVLVESSTDSSPGLDVVDVIKKVDDNLTQLLVSEGQKSSVFV
jgi:hypothetical protein